VRTAPVRAVCSLSVIPHVSWPSGSDPRNAHVSWLTLDSYLLGGDHEPGVEELWLSGGWAGDVVDVGRSPGFVVSPRLRAVLENAAPHDLEFAPIAVDGQPHWLLRVTTQLRARDSRASRAGFPVWRTSALTRQAIFRIPSERDRIYVTDAVATAYLTSQCTGLHLIGPLGGMS
jgi:hypothetical protein